MLTVLALVLAVVLTAAVAVAVWRLGDRVGTLAWWAGALCDVITAVSALVE